MSQSSLSSLVRSFIHITLYGNIWIAIGAVFFTLETALWLPIGFPSTALCSFVFGSTLALYTLHRWVGLQKLEPDMQTPRYQIIERISSTVMLYGVVGGLMAAVSFFWLETTTQWWAVGLAVVASLYALPVLPGGLRMRDLPFIKILVIAISWAVVSVILPVVNDDAEMSPTVWVLFWEHVAFVFAITVPFDIRDLKIDQHQSVRTLPQIFGANGAIFIALLALIVGTLAIWMVIPMDIEKRLVLWAVISITAAFIAGTTEHRKDSYFTGWLDGLLIWRPLLLLLGWLLVDMFF